MEEFVREAFAYVNLDCYEYLEIDPFYFRPTEVDYLCADITKAKRELDWSPSITFHDLLKVMVDADMTAVGLDPPGEGERILKENGLHWIGGYDLSSLKDSRLDHSRAKNCDRLEAVGT